MVLNESFLRTCLAANEEMKNGMCSIILFLRKDKCHERVRRKTGAVTKVKNTCCFYKKHSCMCDVCPLKNMENIYIYIETAS